MAKKKARRTTRKAPPQPQRQTNWLVVGGVIAVGVIALFGLFYLALREPEAVSLAKYCDNNPGACLVHGADNAPVTFVEVSDYGCGFCGDYNLNTAPILEAEYVETGQMRYMVVPFALRARDGSYPTLPTAVAAMCANDQDAFPEFNTAMFSIQSSPLAHTREGYLQEAERLGLDMDAFSGCLDNQAYVDIIQNNVRVAQSAGVSATPTFFINDAQVSGAQPLNSFIQRIEASLGQ